MSIEVAISFGAPQPGRVQAIETATRLIPSLSSGTLERCTVAARRCARALLLHVALAEGAAGEAAAERLAFWSARAGGVGHRLVDDLTRDSVARALASSELVEPDVAPEDLWSVLERGFALLWEREAGSLPVAVPSLSLKLEGDAAEGLCYEPGRRRLSIASRLAPPLGDEFALSFETAASPARSARGAARVVEVRRGPEPRAPSFVVDVDARSDALHALLAETCARAPTIPFARSLRRLLWASA